MKVDRLTLNDVQNKSKWKRILSTVATLTRIETLVSIERWKHWTISLDDWV